MGETEVIKTKDKSKKIIVKSKKQVELTQRCTEKTQGFTDLGAVVPLPGGVRGGFKEVDENSQQEKGE